MENGEGEEEERKEEGKERGGEERKETEERTRKKREEGRGSQRDQAVLFPSCPGQSFASPSRKCSLPWGGAGALLLMSHFVLISNK